MFILSNPSAELPRMAKLSTATPLAPSRATPYTVGNLPLVNEIFERLNTGGVALSSSDILFSRIKDEYPNFEEQLQNCSNQIYID